MPSRVISGAVSREANKTTPVNSRAINSLLASKQFLALLLGTPLFKIGEFHTIFYLCFLVLLVYLLVFALVSFIKKKIVTLLVVVIMSGPFAFGDVEVLTFKQRGGESLKEA